MSDVRWEGLTHEEIYSQVQQGPGRAASADAEAAWTTVGDTIRAVNEQLTRAVKQIGAGWQGAAADAASGGMTVMNNWALDAAGNATLTMDGIAAQAAGAQHVRDAMPPPVPELDKAVALAGAGSYGPRTANVGALEDKAAEDRALAIDLMNQYTSDSTTHQHLMNYWTQPPSVVVETVPAGATPGKGGRGVALGRGAGAVARIAEASAAAGGVGEPGAAAGALPGHVAPGAAPIPGSTTGAPGSTTAGGPVVGRPGAPVPGPSVPGAPGTGVPGAAGTARGGAAPSDRPTIPALPGAPLPGAAVGLPGATLPGSSASRGRPRGAELPPGGVRQVVPGIPARPGGSGARGALDTPWNAPSARATDGLIAGGRGGIAEPGVPRTGLGGFPEGAAGEARGPAGTGARAIVGGPAEDAVAGRQAGPAAARLAAAEHAAPGSGHGILPLGGAAGRPTEQEHRRPGYLVDDTDAFADDRWFTPPVIGGDDPEVRSA